MSILGGATPIRSWTLPKLAAPQSSCSRRPTSRLSSSPLPGPTCSGAAGPAPSWRLTPRPPRGASKGLPSLSAL
eukprot:12943796-Alexandrium_andersonii.AAC.1